MKIESYTLKGFDETNTYAGKSHWMFPRAQRAIPNQLIYDTLKGLKEIEGENSSDREVQHRVRDLWTKELVMSNPEDSETKEVISHRDIKTNSGATRTIFSEYIALGLIHRVNKRLYLTQAGRDILNLNYKKKSENKKIDVIMTHLLCRTQFNSDYFYTSDVKLDKEIKVKPFCFLIMLMMELPVLTKEEMYIPYYKAKKVGDYKRVVKLIKKFRKIKDLPKVLGHSVQSTIKNQCFPQILKSRGIIKKAHLGFSINENFPHLDLIKKYIDEYTEELPFITARQHGEWRKEVTVSHTFDDEKLEKEIQECAKGCSTITELYERFNNYKPSVKRRMRSLVKKNPDKFISIIDGELLSDYMRPKKGEKNEHKLVGLFNCRLGIETVHTGRKKNKKDRGNHSDVFNIFRKQNRCGIIDSKVHHELSYSLPINAHRAMEVYTDSYTDLLDQFQLPDLKLAYVCFVSSGFSDNIEKNLIALTEATGIPVSAIPIQDLIELEKEDIQTEHFLHVMSKGGLITRKNFKPIV